MIKILLSTEKAPKLELSSLVCERIYIDKDGDYVVPVGNMAIMIETDGTISVCKKRDLATFGPFVLVPKAQLVLDLEGKL